MTERVTCVCDHTQTLAAAWRIDFPLTVCSGCGRELAHESEHHTAIAAWNDEVAESLRRDGRVA